METVAPAERPRSTMELLCTCVA